MSSGVRIRQVRAQVYRYPIDAPVSTSFGVMNDRPAVFVRVDDEDGFTGWGEIWCNFPVCGAEHRARLVATIFAPLLKGKQFEQPHAAWRELTVATSVLALQSGEPGPIAQCIAGIDIALHDLVARRAGQPLWKMLGGSSPLIRVYASGLNPDQPERLAQQCLNEGHRAFKLKVGFGIERDADNVEAVRNAIGNRCALMVDANQAWKLDQAPEVAAALQRFDLQLLEEPLRADAPWSEWQQFAQRCDIPLAAGENIASAQAFEQALASRALTVVQPDIAKWGGFSGCLSVAKKISESGARFCPHFLGGGIGLLASAHLLAVAGGDGMLEIDANMNPMRTALAGPLAQISDGTAMLTDQPGLGAISDPSDDEQTARWLCAIY
ncbi:MAG: mandelate racemase/muconate lactonizing enzyme family protein [Burkholderiaceae bacterium]